MIPRLVRTAATVSSEVLTACALPSTAMVTDLLGVPACASAQTETATASTPVRIPRVIFFDTVLQGW